MTSPGSNLWIPRRSDRCSTCTRQIVAECERRWPISFQRPSSKVTRVLAARRESSERGAAHARAYMLAPVRREHARKARLGLARLRHAPGDPTKPRNYSITRLRRRSSNHQGRRDSDFRADYQPTRVPEGSPARYSIILIRPTSRRRYTYEV